MQDLEVHLLVVEDSISLNESTLHIPFSFSGNRLQLRLDYQ